MQLPRLPAEGVGGGTNLVPAPWGQAPQPGAGSHPQILLLSWPHPLAGFEIRAALVASAVH